MIPCQLVLKLAMFFPVETDGSTDSAFYMSRGHVFFSVRRARIVPWLIIFFMFALFAFGFILLVKGANCLIGYSVFPALPRLNQLMDGDSELAFW